jgi:hypothetical protein
MLMRALRKWDDDGVPDREALALGEFILKCGLARFPTSPLLLLISANLRLEVCKQGEGWILPWVPS